MKTDELNPTGDAAEAVPSPGRSIPWLIVLALAAGLALRLVGLADPPYDRHAFRQTQTLFTIEDFYKHGIDMLYPKTIYVGYPGTLVLELPLYQAVAALLYHVFGPHIAVVRLLNILCGALTALVLYRFTARLFGRNTAWLATLIYWLAPLNIAYQRSMLFDSMAVFFALVAFDQLELLLPIEPDSPRPGPPRGAWTRWALFILSTLLAALMKALYLWPAVLLLVQRLVMRRGKLDARLVQVGAVFAAVGACLLVWTVHATRANDLSPFTRGTHATGLLGFAPLFTLDFYHQLLSRSRWWLGAVGLFFYPVGLFAGWLERRDRARMLAFWLIVLIAPTYLAAFALINYPHEYYQLPITPFLAVVPANGLRWLIDWCLDGPRQLTAHPALLRVRRWCMVGSALGLLVFVAALTRRHGEMSATALSALMTPTAFLAFFAAIPLTARGVGWLKQVLVRATGATGLGLLFILISIVFYFRPFHGGRESLEVVKFGQLCAGKVVPDQSAMLFVAQGITHGHNFSDLPEYLYAAKLWGTALTVTNADEGRPFFTRMSPAFPGLQYLVFYGIQLPGWVPQSQFRLATRDTDHLLYVFHSTRDGRKRAPRFDSAYGR
jgi:4-amino-4-deoxy-L-arabinose transferase-like glycosyltransferase